MNTPVFRASISVRGVSDRGGEEKLYKRLIRAKETGRLYQGYFRARSCPEGSLNVESDRIEGICVWCMKKE